MHRDYSLFSCKTPVRPQTDFERVLVMSKCRVAIASVLVVFGFSVASAQQTIVIPDNLFTQAGFLVKYATTPEKDRSSPVVSAGQAGDTEKETAGSITSMPMPSAAIVPMSERPKRTRHTATGLISVLEGTAAH